MYAALRQATRAAVGRRFYTATANSAFLAEREAIREHAQQASNLWFKVSCATIPVLMLAAYNAHRLLKEHEEHMAHHPPENIKYPYMKIRSKPFFWGDGDQTLFYNPKVNDLYEE